jgi:hypothetical protein
MNKLDEALQAITDYKKELVAVVVHLNDTYLIDDLPDRRLPGFAKIVGTIKHLRAHIEEQTGKDLLLVVHSGDFLSPSLVGNSEDKHGEKDHGRTMVKLLNEAGVKYCVLGNHEFDNGVEALADRLREAQFKVLLANSIDKLGPIQQNSNAGAGDIKLQSYAVWPEDGSTPRVALTGVVPADAHKSFVSPDPDQKDANGKPKKVEWIFTRPNEAVMRVWNAIKDDEDDKSATGVAFTTNIPFRFVLTHGTQSEDQQLRREITETPRTYILGGHDHDISYVDYEEKIFIGKNLSNAETIRVMIPLAGGRTVCNEIDAANARLKARQRKAPQYPRDVEAVMLSASDLDRDALRNRIKRAAGFGWCRNLGKTLRNARSEREILNFELRYADHTFVDDMASGIIRDAPGSAWTTSDHAVVCDFTGQMPAFEARDRHIRKELTNMGVLVAECIRLEAKSHLKQLSEQGVIPAGDQSEVVAIVNSGAFRCDSELLPKLVGRDLRETFLFDGDGSIMVLKVSAAVVKKLIEHGKTKPGTGAYPQVAGECTTDEVWLAISAFLLIRSDNNDGYDDVLHDVWGSEPPIGKGLPDIEATRAGADEDAVTRFRITDAVTNHAAAVPVHILPQPPADAVEGAGRLLELLQTYAQTFDENISPNHSSFSNKETWLRSDDHINQSRAIEDARNDVRQFLKELSAVKEYLAVADSPTKGSQWKDKARKAWMEANIDLLDLRDALQNNKDHTLRERDSYVRLFEAAAVGIPGSGLLPALT